MRKTWYAGLAVLGLFAVGSLARAADTSKVEPTLVVRLQSIDATVQDIKFLAAAAEREEVVKQFEGLLLGKSLQGIDRTKPIGLYGTVGAAGLDSTAVAVVPVTSEKEFLRLLSNFNVKTEEDNGLYTVKEPALPNVPVYFRFVDGYAYIGVRDESVIARDAILPAAKLFGKDEHDMLALDVRLDRIPDGIKQLAMGQIGLQLSNLREKQFKGQTRAEKDYSEAVFNEIGDTLKMLLRDGREIGIRLRVDQAKNELSLTSRVTAEEDSELARDLAKYRQNKSMFAGLLSEDAAAQLLLNTLPPSQKLLDKLDPVVDEMIARAVENQKDEKRREMAEKALRALEPTLKAGILDLGLSLRQARDGKHYTLVGGVRVKDGERIDRALHDMVKQLPEGDQEHIKLDAGKAGDVKVHEFDLKDMDRKGREVFGDAKLYLGLRSDAAFMALGEDGQSALREAVMTRPGTAPVGELDVSVSRLAPAFAVQHPEQSKAIQQAAEQAFKKKDSDRIHMVKEVESDTVVRGRLSMKTDILRFASLVQKAMAGQAGQTAPPASSRDR